MAQYWALIKGLSCDWIDKLLQSQVIIIEQLIPQQ